MSFQPSDLRRASIFREASEEDLRLFLSKSILRAAEEDEYFFLQGDPAIFLYILVSGRVKLTQSNPAGRQVNLRTINEWQMFGAIGAVRSGAVYPATAQALEPSAALALESAFLREAMKTRPCLNFGLMELMTAYIQELQERYRELATERVERRIALTILRFASQIGIRLPTEEALIAVPLSRQDVAEASGTTIFTVSRVLAEWERRGLVETGRERVLIRDPHGLVQIADGANQ